MTLSDRIAAVYALDEKKPEISAYMRQYEYREAYRAWEYQFDIPEVVSIIRSLDKQGEKNLIVHGENVNRILSLQTQLTIAVEALEFYADEEIYAPNLSPHSYLMDNNTGTKAQTALKRIREG